MIDDTSADAARADESRTRRLKHEASGSITTTIVIAIAEMEGVDPTEMEPLYGSVDPALLEAVCSDEGQVTGDVVFTYRGYRVTVDSDGGTLIRPATTGHPG